MRQSICACLALALCGCGSISNQNQTLLVNSSVGYNPGIVEALNRGANINCTNQFGESPLLLATKVRRPDTVAILIDRGADLNMRDPLGNTALHLTIFTGQNDLSALLLQRGARSVQNKYGLVPGEMSRLAELGEQIARAEQLLNTDGTWTDRIKGREYYELLQQWRPHFLINAVVMRVLRFDPALVVNHWSGATITVGSQVALTATNSAGQQVLMIPGANSSCSLRLRSLILAVKLGVAGSEKELAWLLDLYGDKTMAEDYLNCGSDALHKAARVWAARRGHSISSGSGSHRAGWGRFE